jgi:hypothetical protein
VAGLGTTRRAYARLSRGARIAPGLAVRGERARTAETDVEAWLRRTGLTDAVTAPPRP